MEAKQSINNFDADSTSSWENSPSNWDIGEFEEELELVDSEVLGQIIERELTYAYEHDARILLLLRKFNKVNMTLLNSTQGTNDSVVHT